MMNKAPNDDTIFAQQVRRAVNKLQYEGRYVANPVLAACAEVMLRDVPEVIPGCSNGADRCALYVAPHSPRSRKGSK